MTRWSLTLTLLLMSAPALFAYQPGRWDPMNLYKTEPQTGGPQQLRVTAPNGALLQRARFEYDSEGRLAKEIFYTAAGIIEGEIHYTYHNKQLSVETLYDSMGRLLSRQIFEHNGSLLSAREVFNGSNQLQLRQQFDIQGNRITGGREISGENVDRFRLQYSNNRLSALVILDEDQKPISTVHYRYDGNGRISERLRENSSGQSLCRYKYDGNGKILSYTYFNKIDGQWIEEKTLSFEY